MAAAGKATGPLAYTDLLPFDQHHYGGVAAVDDAARRCGLLADRDATADGAADGAGAEGGAALTPPPAAAAGGGAAAGKQVINIGSGLGGPARYLAGAAGARVLACELQGELHGAARELTARCGLGDRVAHVAGDFCEVARFLRPASYDAVPVADFCGNTFARIERAALHTAATARMLISRSVLRNVMAG